MDTLADTTSGHVADMGNFFMLWGRKKEGKGGRKRGKEKKGRREEEEVRRKEEGEWKIRYC